MVNSPKKMLSKEAKAQQKYVLYDSIYIKNEKQPIL